MENGTISILIQKKDLLEKTGLSTNKVLYNIDIYPDEELMRKLFVAKILPPDIDRVMTRQWVDIKSPQ